jgi:hypothetical protein
LELSKTAWQDIPDGETFRKRLTFAYSAERRSIQGGTGSSSVKAQIKEAEQCLKSGAQGKTKSKSKTKAKAGGKKKSR